MFELEWLTIFHLVFGAADHIPPTNTRVFVAMSATLAIFSLLLAIICFCTNAREVAPLLVRENARTGSIAILGSVFFLAGGSYIGIVVFGCIVLGLLYALAVFSFGIIRSLRVCWSSTVSPK